MKAHALVAALLWASPGFAGEAVLDVPEGLPVASESRPADRLARMRAFLERSEPLYQEIMAVQEELRVEAQAQRLRDRESDGLQKQAQGGRAARLRVKRRLEELKREREAFEAKLSRQKERMAEYARMRLELEEGR